MAEFSYYEGEGDGTTYSGGHSTTTLFITNEDTGEERAYSGWTYLDCEDEDDEQYILEAIWTQSEEDGYGADEMPYTVTTEASK